MKRNISLIIIFILPISLMADYESKFQDRANKIFNNLASHSNSKYSWAAEHLMAKAVALYELNGTDDNDANDILNGSCVNCDYKKTDRLFHFSFYSISRILFYYPNAPAVKDNKNIYFKKMLNRDDGYNLWTGEGTENHVNMCRTTGYLIAEYAVRNDKFPEAQQRIDDMRKWIDRFSKRCLSHGTGEWNSTTYTPFNLVPWINLYDFAKNDTVKKQAKAVLDYYASEIALHYTDGITGGAESRMNKGNNESTNTNLDFLAWLWYGDTPKSNSELFNNGSPKGYTQAGFAAISDYRPPKLLRKLAKKEFKSPAYYKNSKPSYWQDEDSQIKQNFYISNNYTLGAAYLPFGGFHGVTWQNMPWKLVSEAKDYNTANTIFGNGRFYTKTNGITRSPFTQIIQNKNVIIQLTKFPSNLEDIINEVKTYTDNWKDKWNNDFYKRHPDDKHYPKKVNHNFGGRRNKGNASYVSIPDIANTTTKGNVYFVDIDSIYVAIRTINHTKPGIDNDKNRKLIQDSASKGILCGLITEVGDKTNYNSFDAFQDQIINNTNLDKSKIDADEITYKSENGDIINATYNSKGSYDIPLFDFGYGPTNPQVIIKSPPFKHPDFPSGKGYGRIPDWSVNEEPIELDNEWPVYSGPNLYINDGVLKVNDNQGNCYSIDYTGKVPQFGNNCKVTNISNYIDNNKTENIKIYPNPAADNIKVYTGSNSSYKLLTYKILDINGKVIKTGKFNNQSKTGSTYSLKTNNISKGMYLLKIKGKNRLFHKEFYKK